MPGDLWKLLPHTFAAIMSEGAWIAFKYLVMISHVIAMAIAMGGGRIAISVPPRHGKSWFLSQWVPTWFLANWPGKRVILTTYEANFAATWGRRVRNIVAECGHRVGLFLSDDSTAANNWATSVGGGMVTAGVGGPITGKGGDLILCDDPHKNWQEAQSETIRKTIQDWFDSTLYTRLEPGATIVVLHCMAGDTPVLMADGTEKDLKDIRPGDMVATYKDGRLAESNVVNWVNNGLDKVFTIKTTSGIIVKANQRHPFLINDRGVKKWIRVKDLRPGHEIYRVNGVNGKVKLAMRKDATSLLSAEDTVLTTITQNGGLIKFIRHPIMLYRTLRTNLNIVMASHWSNMIKCMLRKVGVVRSANAMLRRRTTPQDGERYCVSITAMELKKSGGSCATTATCSVSDLPPLKCLKKPSDTSSFVLEKIESITYAGTEDVFDVQIAETENFIANQLVSHNTRWHEDDLIGYLKREKPSDGWFHIRIPAIAEEDDDPVGRMLGDPLCPERYDINALNRIKTNLSAMMWAALFQQRPAPAEGTIFKRENWKRYRIPPKCHFVLQSWDTASKKNLNAAYSVCQTWGVSDMGAVLLARWRDRVEYPQLRRQAEIQYMTHRPNVVLIEDRDSGQALLQSLQQETSMPVIGVYPDLDKVIRAQAVSPWHEAGRVWVPATSEKTAWVDEMIENAAMFPNAMWKDDIDTMSQALAYIMTMAIGGHIQSGVKRRTTQLLNGFRDMM